MTTHKTWMVRAGRNGLFFEDFRDRSIVAIGWADVGDLSDLRSREAIANVVRRAFPDYSEQSVGIASGQLFRFSMEFAENDRVVTYDPRSRRYLCGAIAGPYIYAADEENPELINQRSVSWDHEISRDEISDSGKNSLGSIITIFKISATLSAELWGEGGIHTGMDFLR